MPPAPPKPKGGRPRLPDRAALTGVLFVLKVERTLAWLARFRRLAVRHERRADVHPALATLGRALVCLNRARRFC